MMESMIVVTCPGQGSQTPGFLLPWIEDTRNRDTLEQLSASSGIDLVKHGTESDADTIRDTAVAQPLIVAAGILAWNSLMEIPGAAAAIGGVAGHSVGEITAAYAAGIFDADTAMRFVARRSQLMAQDAAATPTSMSAVLGGDEDVVLARLAELDLTPANFNGGGQIVAAGAPEALAALRSEPAPGTRVIPLKVAGAFHTRYMEQARTTLAADAEHFEVRDPVRTIWSNETGSVVTDGVEFRAALIRQLAQPVRWDACMRSFADAGVTSLIELAPAGTLSGLAKRALKGTPTLALSTPADLDVARERIAADA